MDVKLHWVNKNTKLYYLSQLFHSLIFTIPIWIVYYQGKITVAEISFLVTFQYLMQMLLELPSGALADLIGRKHTLAIGYFFGALSFVIFPLGQTFFHFLVLTILGGIMDSFRSGAEEAIIYDTYKQAGREDQISKVYFNSNLIYQFGLVAATIAGGIIYKYNIFLPFFLKGISLTLGFITVSLFTEPKIDSEKFSLRNYFKQIFIGTKEIFKDSYTTNLSLFYIFVSGIAWAGTLYFNDYMFVELGFDSSERGLISGGMRLVNVFVIGAILRNKKIFNEGRTILFFPVIMLVAFLPGIFLDGVYGLPFVQMAVIVTTARWIVLAPITNKAFSSKYRATAISAMSLLIGIIYVVLTGISGRILSEYSVKEMYSIMGLISLVTVVPLAVRMRRGYR